MRAPMRSVPSAGGLISPPAPDATGRTGQVTMPEKSPARPASPQVTSCTDDEIWLRVTREVADDLAVDALVRDRAGKPPFDELARLREAGLPALLTPPGPAGRGTGWRTACAVIREIAAADGSIGELLGHHYVLSWSARFFGTPDRAEELELRASAEQWLWGGGIDLPDTEPVTGHGLTLTPAEGGYLLHGCRSFAAGVTVADRLMLGAVRTDTDESLVVCVDPAHPGVTAAPSTTASASGSPRPAGSASTASRSPRTRYSAPSHAMSTPSRRSPRSPRWRSGSPSSMSVWASPKERLRRHGTSPEPERAAGRPTGGTRAGTRSGRARTPISCSPTGNW
ncbi:hypothetical protein Srufu_001710 [Streptomyces libani subsp. rufus]|nr:hypothetical protein Srufu_001710 [Streptomyces libani subsp. rufus]